MTKPKFIPPAISQAKRRRGFTLVELLVSMAILAILAALVMVGVSAANESAKKRKTETLIATLHTLLMERYDTYQTRRVPVKTTGLSPANAADKRLLALRELMKIEMPDRWSDVTYTPTLVPKSSLARAYERRYWTLQSQDSAWPTRQFQSAECLYMLITMGTGEGEARSFFSDRDIGDVDNDGAPEFLDGWGKPIAFLRWPAGFVSELQTGDADKDHDPFDSLRRDMAGSTSGNSSFTDSDSAYRLVPLIYSAGADDLYDIEVSPSEPSSLDPYKPLGATTQKVGAAFDVNGDGDENWHDNIHNHLLGRR